MADQPQRRNKMTKMGKKPLDEGRETEMSQNGVFLTMDDVARLLHLAPRTVYNWTVDKKVPFYKIRGSIRFKRSDLETWIEKGKRDES